jgi:hypothetical protein
MEVHHHAHTSRKKWIHYFWEFFMLFLAVTLGFFMENQREHFVENHRAKLMAQSLFNDLKNDTALLGKLTEQRNRKLLVLDSLMNEMDKPLLSQDDTLLGKLCNPALYNRMYFISELGTYEQIKNSGSLRYYKMDLQKALVNYEAATKHLYFGQDLENKFAMENIVPFLMNLENPRFFRAMFSKKPITGLPPFRSKKSDFEGNLYNYAIFIKERTRLLIDGMERVKSKAIALIFLLQKEYHLE